MRKNIIMILKYISWMLVIGSIIGTVVYFNVYDRMTRAPLKVLWVDSPYARDLRNILDEFTDRTNISVQVDSVPRELYREAITRDLDTLDQAYDIVIGEAVWASQDISRNYYADIGDLVRDSWLFKTYSPATDGEIFVRKNGAYYGMPVALDVFGIVYAEGEPAPETLEGLTGGSLVSEARLSLPSRSANGASSSRRRARGKFCATSGQRIIRVCRQIPCTVRRRK